MFVPSPVLSGEVPTIFFSLAESQKQIQSLTEQMHFVHDSLILLKHETTNVKF